MRAEELMIGDWVCVNGLTQQVFDLAYNQNEKELTIGVLDPQGDVYQCFYGFDHVEPIPLTGEILEKNFAKRLFFDGECEGYSYVTDGMQIDQLADSVFEWICPGTINGILNLRYVHELQHALRLCGIEKEIVL